MSCNKGNNLLGANRLSARTDNYVLSRSSSGIGFPTQAPLLEALESTEVQQLEDAAAYTDEYKRTLQASLDAEYAKITYVESTYATQESAYASVKMELDVNGAIAGYSILNDGILRSFTFNANDFKIWDESSGVAPFVYSGTTGTIALNTNVIIDGDLIVNGSINGTKIGKGQITGGTGGNMALSTITGANIVARTIKASLIAAGTITANEIYAGTITADKLVARTLTLNNIDYNQLTYSDLEHTLVSAKYPTGTIVATFDLGPYETVVATLNGYLFSGSLTSTRATAAGTISAYIQDQFVNIGLTDVYGTFLTQNSACRVDVIAFNTPAGIKFQRHQGFAAIEYTNPSSYSIQVSIRVGVVGGAAGLEVSNDIIYSVFKR